MKVFVCSRTAVSRVTKRVGATHVLSLMDPGKRPFLHPKTPTSNWLLLHCEDQIEATAPHSPTRDQVQRLLDWAQQLPRDSVVLCHCEAGISRSTAAALAILVQHHGADKIQECVNMLLDVRPEACPNPIITQLADDILGCGGELHASAEQVANARLLKNFGRGWNRTQSELTP